MQKLSGIFCTLLLVLFLFTTANGAIKNPPPKKHAPPAKIVTDTAKIQLRKFDQAALKRFNADKDFNYDGHDAGNEPPSLWNRFWSWVWEKILQGINAVPYGGAILGYLFVGLCVAFLAYMIFKALGIDAMQILRGRSTETGIAYTESLENINEINFDAELEKAIAQHNYRLAVRLLYLKCLKQLSDTQLIQWQIDKTNTAYLYEIKDPAQKQTFGMLTRQFEYVWYGNFIIDKDAFGNINTLFQNFKKQLP